MFGGGTDAPCAGKTRGDVDSRWVQLERYAMDLAVGSGCWSMVSIGRMKSQVRCYVARRDPGFVVGLFPGQSCVSDTRGGELRVKTRK